MFFPGQISHVCYFLLLSASSFLANDLLVSILTQEQWKDVYSLFTLLTVKNNFSDKFFLRENWQFHMINKNVTSFLNVYFNLIKS